LQQVYAFTIDNKRGPKGGEIMAITVTTITDFLTLVGPLFTVMQGLAYLSYIVIAVAIVGANLSTFFIAALKFV